MNTTLSLRANGSTIDASWWNTIRSALMVDQYPRNSSGVATDQGGSLGSSSSRWVNAYLINLFLYNSAGTYYQKHLLASGGAADQTLTWPNALPVSTLPMQISASGIITFAQIPTGGIADGAVTPAKLGVRNEQLSSSSANFSGSSLSYADVTSMINTITTTGRTVENALIPDGNLIGGISGLAVGTATGVIHPYAYIECIRSNDNFSSDNNVIGVVQLGITAQWATSIESCSFAPGAVRFIDLTPAAGTYKYKLKYKSGDAAGTLYVGYCKLMTVEL